MGNVFDLNDGVNDGRDEGEEADRAEGVGLDALAVSRLRHEDHRGAVVVRRTGFSAGGVETKLLGFASFTSGVSYTPPAYVRKNDFLVNI